MRAAPHRAKAHFPKSPHDHETCVTATLGAAEALTRERRLRFTPLRRRVLEIVSRSHRPLGAYDVLAVLTKSAPRRPRLGPPTVYRALEFLLANGLVHRIDSLNAFVACFAPSRPHRAYFFLCETCGRAAEIEDAALLAALKACAETARFTVARETVEIAGRCAACAGRRGG